MDINYQEIAQKAVAHAAQNNIQLDYSAESFEKVDNILQGDIKQQMCYIGILIPLSG